MRKLRTCNTVQFNTGVSKCPPDFGKMLGAIIVEDGTKLPADLTADKLEKLAHASGSGRIYGIIRFVEYAPEGGEPQSAANGYGPEEFTGFSARKDTFTLNKFYPELHSAITRTAHLSRGVYFFDENNMLYGLNDGTDTLAPYPMSSVYSKATPHPTSSAKPSMSVTFCHVDAKAAAISFEYIQLDFNLLKLTLGLTGVKLEKVGTAGDAYKLYEAFGGYDVTPIYGPLIATAGEAVVSGAASAFAYDETTQTLTIAASADADVRLKSPAVLYDNDIKGIEQVTT